jgi:hypothetical protein
MFVWLSPATRVSIPTVRFGAAALAAPPVQAQVEHVWECPAEVASDLLGQFEILPRLIVGLMRTLADAALPGVVRLTLRVCASDPGETEWTTDVTVLPPALP